MNDYPQVGQATALVAIVSGLLICFCGYRIIKLSLALIGFAIGAFAGWEIGISFIQGGTGVSLLSALIGGLIGMGLCLWLYFLGIFLLGAAAGTVVAGALFSGTAHQIQPIIMLVLPVVFGVFALLAQKFMIVVSTAFSGAYLVIAGAWPFVAGSQAASQVWLHPTQKVTSGPLGYGALALWLILALLGVSFQFRAKRAKAEAAAPQK